MDDNVYYAEARAEILENLWKELQEKQPEDILEWATGKIMQVKGCSKEEAEAILKEIMEGIKLYRQIEASQERYSKELRENMTEQEKEEFDNQLGQMADRIISGLSQEKQEN